MKSLNTKNPFTINDLLNYLDQLDTHDLQRVADRIASLLSQRKKTSPEEREKELLAILGQKLPTAFWKRFEELNSKMESGMLPMPEIQELEAYIEKAGEWDIQKIKALHDLAKIRKIPIQQLANELAVFSQTNFKS